MRDELSRFRVEMQAVFADVEKLLRGLTEDEAAKRPSPEEWSIAECLDHLTMTAKGYVPAIEHHLAAGKPKGGDSYRPGWLWRKFVESMEPPVKRKYRTRAGFVPAGARGVGEVQRDFIAAHEWIVARLEALDALDLSRIKIESPFAKWVNYPLGLVFYILPAHCRRHLWQAANVKKAVLPPAGT